MALKHLLPCISLHLMLKCLSLAVAAIAATSIVLWLTDANAMINPFISLMALICAPFIYAMGLAANKNVQ